jgi:5-hydroxyisourate hydrolase
MSIVTTHVLDTALGRPAPGIEVHLESIADGHCHKLASAITDSDGRCGSLAANIPAGVYRLTFLTGAYFARQNRASIYPEITITFICSGEGHYHLPLLLSDNSYTTYRGS